MFVDIFIDINSIYERWCRYTRRGAAAVQLCRAGIFWWPHVRGFAGTINNTPPQHIYFKLYSKQFWPDRKCKRSIKVYCKVK